MPRSPVIHTSRKHEIAPKRKLRIRGKRGDSDEALMWARTNYITEIESKLAAATGETDPRIHWSRDAYIRLVVLKYGVVIIGVPQEYRKYRFTAPSDIKEVNALRELTRLWNKGVIYFHKLTAAEQEAMEDRYGTVTVRRRAPTTGTYHKGERLLHEVGLKCKQRPKSVAYIENSDVEDSENEEEDSV